jgi:UDP-N-acetylglucosamine 2-epimerase (non-hydrolysing)/GDP/UDP-N,N'-diacetylbacillosamine 2-epimerase (hydrolysing)
MTRKICIITGSRAEYGLLYWLMKGIQDDIELQLQVVVTGMHLSPEFGLTYKVIEADGFTIDSKVEMLLSSDTPVGAAKSIGLGVASLAEAMERLGPNMVVVLGDRFEIFAAAQAAMVLQIPLVHLAGGDNGLGTYDNIIRHCITKMACLHFVTHEDARRRVIQLGELPSRVFCFGATSVENIVKMPLLPKDVLERELGVAFEKVIFLVTFHPLTMDEFSAEVQLQALLNALDGFLREKNCSVIFTKSNADNGGRVLNHILEEYVKRNPNCHLFDSLGQTRYLSMMKHASVVLGNSSSGIYEAPYLQTPTVDIGSRQRGRAAPTSVIRCEADEISIREAILAAVAFEFHDVAMIYGDGNTSRKILGKIKELIDFPGLTIKKFFDMEARQ